MTVTVDIPEEIEAQLIAAARAQGVPVSDYVRDFILERYREDAEDLRTASERLSDPQPGLTSSELRKRLGLED
jgi:predicted DNA-binding protein